MQQPRSILLAIVVTVVTALAGYLLILRPLQPVPASASPVAAARTAEAAPSTARATRATQAAKSPGTSTPAPATTEGSTGCVAGIPSRLVIPALKVDASFENIGVDATAPADASGKKPLGNPGDRTQAGWYSDGPRPGSGTGTVLVNGHTYHDGSAIFKESFAAQIADGQRIDIEQRNGSTCSYRVQRVWRDIDAKSDYPTIVQSEGLYDFRGPERLFLATCGGDFNASLQNYDHISMLVATPIDR